MTKKKLTVLSLFNGMSCGQLALERVGFKVGMYISSEIDKPAIRVTQYNYPNTLQIGDVTKIKYKNGILYYANDKNIYIGKIDLVIGGSPCQDLSFSNTSGQGLDGDRSGLFYEFVRILKEVNPEYFLLENVIMKKVWKKTITDILKIDPIEINSNMVSAQNRRRLYWTNIPNVTQPTNKKIKFKDVIYDDNYKVFQDPVIENTKRLTRTNVVQWDSNGKGNNSQWDRAYFKENRICTIPKTNAGLIINIVKDYDNGIYRKIHPIEAERCQTVPDNYTNVPKVTENQRFAMLGNGWTVDVISHIFKNMSFNETITEKEKEDETVIA